MDLSYFRSDLGSLEAYSSAGSKSRRGKIKLDANEMPSYQTPFNEYPEPQPMELLDAFANKYGVAKDNLLMTRGADEGIELVIKSTCLGNSRKVLYCPPTYGMYQKSAESLAVQTIRVDKAKSGKSFSIDLDALRQRIQEEWIGVVFICRPDNPTGETMNLGDLESVADTCKQNSTLVAIDEAYIEFSEEVSATSLIERFDNIVVLRTLSKAFAAAGLRVGFLISNEKNISLIRKIHAPYPLSAPSIQECSEIVKNYDFDSFSQRMGNMKVVRDDFQQQLERNTLIKKVYSSDTNFLFIELLTDAETIREGLWSQGICIRNQSQKNLEGQFIRITIGDQVDMDKIITYFKDQENEKNTLLRP